MRRLLRKFTQQKLETPPIIVTKAKDYKFRSMGGFQDSQTNTPKQIFEYLDNFVVGQDNAKRALAIAYRNRWRRKQLPSDLQGEVYPKNILLVGPTGCGKTELARRLSKLSDSPFIKVEATQFTEVGYHGKDVESIINDFAGLTIRKSRDQLSSLSDDLSKEMSELVDIFLLEFLLGVDNLDEEKRLAKLESLRNGYYDDFQVSIELPKELYEQRFERVDDYLDYLTELKPPFEKPMEAQTVKVSRARNILIDFYLMKMHFRIDFERSAIDKIENEGIVIIDEIDKVVHSHNSTTSGRSPSTEGVQRDLLPIIEGTLLNTKFGDINTNHILFICAGAFSNSSPSDLMPELLGRLPLRINMKSLTKKEMAQILRNVEFNLLDQYKSLMMTEGITLNFEEPAIDYICQLAEEINLSTENIGARRLHSLLEQVLEEISYNGPDSELKEYTIDKTYVDLRMKDYTEKHDYYKYLL